MIDRTDVEARATICPLLVIGAGLFAQAPGGVDGNNASHKCHGSGCGMWVWQEVATDEQAVFRDNGSNLTLAVPEDIVRSTDAARIANAKKALVNRMTSHGQAPVEEPVWEPTDPAPNWTSRGCFLGKWTAVRTNRLGRCGLTLVARGDS